MTANPSFDPEWASPAEWARMYRQTGLQVVPARFPMKTRDDKRPALADWREFQREQVDEAIFAKWFPADAKRGPVAQRTAAAPPLKGRCMVATPPLCGPSAYPSPHRPTPTVGQKPGPRAHRASPVPHPATPLAPLTGRPTRPPPPPPTHVLPQGNAPRSHTQAHTRPRAP